MSKFMKIFLISCVFLVLFVFIAGTVIQFVDRPRERNYDPTPSPTTQKTTENPQTRSFSSSSVNISIRSEIVKKVAPNLYRYFFFITNNDSPPFRESIVIGLLEENGIQIAFDEISPQTPIQSKQSRYCYVDSRCGPFEISRGSLVIKKFEWRVHVNYQTIQRGSGAITSKYEDASY